MCAIDLQAIPVPAEPKPAACALELIIDDFELLSLVLVESLRQRLR